MTTDIQANTPDWRDNPGLFPRPGFGPAGRGFGGTPVGAVVAFAGPLGAARESDPYQTSAIEQGGWMACDGRTLAPADYPELFVVLGYQYGGDGNSFRIPDYRGYFLRGPDDGAGQIGSIEPLAPAGAGEREARPASISVNYLIKFTHGL